LPPATSAARLGLRGDPKASTGCTRFLGGSDHCVATTPRSAVALTALDATIEVQGAAARRKRADHRILPVPAIRPERETVLMPERSSPPCWCLPSGARAFALSEAARTAPRSSSRWSPAAVVVAIEDSRIRAARVAMGGVGTRPWRLARRRGGARPAAAMNPRGAANAVAQAAGAGHSRKRLQIPLMQRALARALLTVTREEEDALDTASQFWPRHRRQPVDRRDGRLKVTGQARYAAESTSTT